MSKGFFLIHRSLLDDYLFTDTGQRGKGYDTFHAWVYMLGKANYKQTKRVFRGQEQIIERGQLVTSYAKLAETFGWSEDRVRRYLTILKKDGRIKVNSTKHGTIITIIGYDEDQGSTVSRNYTKDRSILTSEERKWFDMLWELYPRHAGKAEAENVFAELSPDKKLLNLMLWAVYFQKEQGNWDEEQYIPYLYNWLEGERWNDDTDEYTFEYIEEYASKHLIPNL